MNKKILTGPKGGQYWVDDSGKKHYIKKTVAQKAGRKIPKSPNKIPDLKYRYVVNIRLMNEAGEYEDDWNEWTEAYTDDEAIRDIQSDYNTDKYYYDFTIIEKEKI